jgi:voltage-gated potassium channel
LSTVGLSSGVEITTSFGKLITLFVIVNGVGIATYLFTVGASIVIGGELKQFMGMRIMQRKIKQMNGHYIVCGIGESSLQVIRDFTHAKAPYVLIDINPDKVEQMIGKDIPTILGDATTEESLLAAGIDRAKGLIANLDDDADNVFTVLTARTLNPDLFIVSKVGRQENIEKLKKVGANRVVSPSLMGGRRMSASVLKTSVVDFLDLVVGHDDKYKLQMESVNVGKNSEVVGKTMRDSEIRSRSGVIVVAMEHDELVFVNPDADTVLAAGDKLIVLGETEQIVKLRKML